MLLSTPHGNVTMQSPTRSSLALYCAPSTFLPFGISRLLAAGSAQVEETIGINNTTSEKRQIVTCLPDEILTAIMETLSVNDLTCVVRVCQRLHAVGVRPLYGHVSLIDTVTSDVVGNPNALPRTGACCSTLVRRPQLAKLVHRLHFQLQPSAELTSWKLPNSLVAPIGTMLRQLPNLVQLELRVLGASLVDILANSPFSLKIFSCDTCDPRPLHGFLVRQPELTELHLVGPTQPVGSFLLDDRHGRNLRKLSGTLDVVAAIVPGRPIEDIRIVDAFLSTEMIRTRVHLLATSSATIKVFRVVTVICQSSMVELIAEHLPDIEVLGLHVLAPSDRHIPYVNLLDSMAPAIAMLPRLQKLDACGADEYEQTHNLEHLAKEQALLETWSMISHTLSHVKFPTGVEWARYNGLWTRVRDTDYV